MSSETASILTLRALSYRYPSGQRALDDVSLEIAPGERVAIVGPSGAGKSTLLLHLNGLLPEKLPSRSATNGASSIMVDGLPLCRETRQEIRRRVGLLFQDPDDQLFCPTVQEDVAFGPLNMGLPAAEIARRVADSLRAVELHGYEQRSTLQLSVGERKRVCLAGVLACQPKILVLDEPTSNLDPRARRHILQILDTFEGTQVIATHDLDFVVQHCNRAVVLDEGRLRAAGPPTQILSDAVLMERHGLEVPLRLQRDARTT